jgi:putative transposase
MKRVVRVKLQVTPEQSVALARTLALTNKAANIASVAGFSHGVTTPQALQRLVYADMKALGLSAQPALHVIRKTAGAYATLRANGKAGHLGRPGSKKWERAFGKPVRFRPDAAQPFDDRSLSWKMAEQTVSIWTTEGRMQGIGFTGHPAQLADLADHRKGETDLVAHQGNWYLVATLDVPTRAVAGPAGFIGVDMGIVNIATTSTGANWSGKHLNKVRARNLALRKKLQKKGTKSAKRLLRKRTGREARFVTDTNHIISKQIVTEAQRTGHGIAIEDLTGIRGRARLRKPQRVTLHSWAFAQLGGYIGYKAEAAGVAFVHIDPAYTSQQCSDCGHIEKKNRTDQATFACRSCGVTLNADANASRNIAQRGVQAWGAVNLPNAA